MQLTQLVTTAIDTGGYLGWSLAIYDPDRDADGEGARRIIELIGAEASVLK
jgi:arginase